MSDVWDKVAASKPVNRQTALSNAGGLHNERKIKQTPIKSWDDHPHTLRAPMPGAVDLRGRVVGRLTVIGLLDRHKSGFSDRKGNPSNKPAKWLVRCACSRFEHRTAKAICSPENAHDRCEHCRRTAKERRRAWVEQTGRDDREWWEF